MTVETTIQWMFDNYPDLFPDRQKCYDHLFCTIGNGYEWRRGQLVRYDEEDNPKAEEQDYLSYPPMAVQSEENVRKYMERMELFKDGGLPKSPRWYPLCEYSKINNVPEDVKPDWKAAVEECKEMLMKDGIKLDEGEQKNGGNE